MIKTELFTKTKPLLSERVQKLISQIFAHNPKICIERALFVTESYMENEYKPTVIKRALGYLPYSFAVSIIVKKFSFVIA